MLYGSGKSPICRYARVAVLEAAISADSGSSGDASTLTLGATRHSCGTSYDTQAEGNCYRATAYKQVKPAEQVQQHASVMVDMICIIWTTERHRMTAAASTPVFIRDETQVLAKERLLPAATCYLVLRSISHSISAVVRVQKGGVRTSIIPYRRKLL